MPSITSVVKNLKHDYPQFKFKVGSDYLWSHQENTIFYPKNSDVELLFHELGHAILKHFDYKRDVELLSMETAAWDIAKQLAKKYKIDISDKLVDSHLDTYRDWLHARSKCKYCQAVGLQIKSNTYTCIACNKQWLVNEARTCGLKRYTPKIK